MNSFCVNSFYGDPFSRLKYVDIFIYVLFISFFVFWSKITSVKDFFPFDVFKSAKKPLTDFYGAWGHFCRNLWKLFHSVIKFKLQALMQCQINGLLENLIKRAPNSVQVLNQLYYFKSRLHNLQVRRNWLVTYAGMMESLIQRRE